MELSKEQQEAIEREADKLYPTGWESLERGVYIAAATAYALKAKKLVEALDSILNTSEDKGREGCTYGDTKFDSPSAAYGYNTCLREIQRQIIKALSSYNQHSGGIKTKLCGK